MGWPEQRATELRKLTGGDVERLAILLEPAVTLYPTRGLACCLYLAGVSLAFAPYRDTRRELHELAHGVLTVGLGLHMKRCRARYWRRQLAIDEARATRFAAVYLGE